jgi:hypothetical protein
MRQKLRLKADLIALLEKYKLSDYCEQSSTQLADGIIRDIEDKAKISAWKNQKL